MPAVKDALTYLGSEIGKTEKVVTLSFEEYLDLAAREPGRVLRNIFQLFYDMVNECVDKGTDEYPDDPESIGFVKYDCTRLFAERADNPFFADRLFANRFIRQIESLRQGFQQNRIYAYEGPSGCGKSTFLNNLLRTFVAYTNTRAGQIFELVWEIDGTLFSQDAGASKKLVVPCPSHDYPILVVPKEHRPEFLRKLLPDGEAKQKILGSKEYEWLFTGEVCTVCKSIFELALEKLGSVEKVFTMLRARTYKFDRRLGEGISVFNPGDQSVWVGNDGKPTGGVFTNKPLQQDLDRLFGAGRVKYVFSSLAQTNNGIHVLMDVKGYNKARLLELHNVISEGVHKVGGVEEGVTALFFALMNPEDKRVITDEKMESFEGRIQYNKIPYVLAPDTEVDIYRSIFGSSIVASFLPRVLENFARVIISSRMNMECKPLKEWIPDVAKYKKYCDESGLLLRMAIYMGVIPNWLSEEDRKKFAAPVRRALIAEGENEGGKGFSGRDSLRLFGEFFSRYSGRPSLITMENVEDFFKHRIGRERRDEFIPKNFLAALIGAYDYAILNEMKEAMYFYNKERISRDILNYLHAVNYEVETKIQCPFTGEEMEVTMVFLKLMASRIAGREMSDSDALKFAQDIQKKFTVAAAKGGGITETELYNDLFAAYVRNLKEKVLQPFAKNANFREAIRAFGTREFETFDTRLKEHVIAMIKNMMEKFGYTEQGAKEICLYVIDKNLAEKYS
ncbi:MAG: serine protein kinase PrkA [Candidatus Sungbacteria bacterium]|nr:serine protein kinase PrkA [Candidatus Sungbacteria bacterium]